MKKGHLFLYLCLALLSVSCKTTNLFEDGKSSNAVADLDSVFVGIHPPSYQIRINDKITISVWGQDELSVGSTYGIYNSNEVYGKWLMVDRSGNIEVPKIGTMYVEKLTIEQLKDSLRLRFAEWIRMPIVDVKVLNREITVLGEVREPQVVPIDKERNTLLELIAKCKGFDFYANVKNVKVLRQVGEHVHVATINLTSSGEYTMKNINLCPGDIVIVPSKKNKEFDKRVSIIIPFTTTLTAAAILMGAF